MQLLSNQGGKVQSILAKIQKSKRILTKSSTIMKFERFASKLYNRKKSLLKLFGVLKDFQK